MAEAQIKVTLTETDQYRRLVMFLEEVRHYSYLLGDEHLIDMVEDCHDDLIEGYQRRSS